ncbi:hypothetical protein LBMAG53_22800 [Planctomycetota bacterium]|nr:hypothetical protein LBMAG53_22800 [Planctomycetota bacterium]
MRFALLLVVVAAAAAAELATKDGRKLTYDTIDCDPSLPKATFLLRTGTTLTSLRLNEVEPAALPKELQEKITAFSKKQLDAGMVLHEEEWLNRNETLLRLDKRFTYKKKVPRSGKNTIEITNREEANITIGIRRKVDGTGLEVTIEPNRTRGFGQLADGAYYFYIVRPMAGDRELDVQKTDGVDVRKEVIYSLTIGAVDGGTPLRGVPAGTIPVPDQWRAGGGGGL